MNGQLIRASDFRKIILEEMPIIDVRAPIEYFDGAFPGSVNLPIMNNEERAKVGTTYKLRGRDSAIELGNQLVSGQIREQRVQSWCEYIVKNPQTIVTCFRGGLRSKIAQEWIFQTGIARPRIDGGYKALRSYLIAETERLSNASHLLIVSGATGSGKTILLRAIHNRRAILDLEKIANHRGSAFGANASSQPNQTNFENELAGELIRIESRLSSEKQSILVEDESCLVGDRSIPSSYFALMRRSPVILIEESLEVRIENTYQEYVVNAGPLLEVVFETFKSATKRISKKLGGVRTQEILKNIDESILEFGKSKTLETNKVWIRKLLEWYYDPMYSGSIEKRDPKIIFKGTRQEVLTYLESS